MVRSFIIRQCGSIAWHKENRLLNYMYVFTYYVHFKCCLYKCTVFHLYSLNMPFNWEIELLLSINGSIPKQLSFISINYLKLIVIWESLWTGIINSLNLPILNVYKCTVFHLYSLNMPFNWEIELFSHILLYIKWPISDS
jgi:hypothetical protein